MFQVAIFSFEENGIEVTHSAAQGHDWLIERIERTLSG